MLSSRYSVTSASETGSRLGGSPWAELGFVSAVLSAEQYELHAQDGGVLLRAWVPFTELRPPAPPTPEDFGSVVSRDGAIDGSSPLELQYRGGWYQVRDDT